MTDFPATLAKTSYPAERGTLPFAVILRDFGPGAHQRYVTHCINESGDASLDGAYWGHYFTDEGEARDDYRERCAKYDRRFAA